MIRTQIQLTEDLAAQIKRSAAREHLSMAEMIRRAVARFLESDAVDGADARYVRAMEAAGRFKAGNRRLSTEHDAAFSESVRQ